LTVLKFMTDQKASESELKRRLQRELEHEKYVEALKKVKEQKAATASIQEKFADKQDNTEELLNEGTTGRQSLNDYRRKRERIQREMSQMLKPPEEEKKKRQKIEVPKQKGRLSFNDEDHEESDEEPVFKKQKSSSAVFMKRKIGKDPSVDTSFLPDKDRDEELERDAERKKLEWLDEQERIKEEFVRVDYCYYDGTSHQKSYSVKKSTLVKNFVEEAKLTFPELKGVSTDQLLFVKENWIVPHNFTFYELMEIHGRRRAPALANWTEESAIGRNYQLGEMNRLAKMVERNFYEKNKHNIPLSEWVVFSPPVTK